jgi:hypothetical protein
MLKLAAQSWHGAQYEGWICRSTIVWVKTNPGPESVKDRPTNVHEFVYLVRPVRSKLSQQTKGMSDKGRMIFNNCVFI